MEAGADSFRGSTRRPEEGGEKGIPGWVGIPEFSGQSLTQGGSTTHKSWIRGAPTSLHLPPALHRNQRNSLRVAARSGSRSVTMFIGYMGIFPVGHPDHSVISLQLSQTFPLLKSTATRGRPTAGVKRW